MAHLTLHEVRQLNRRASKLDVRMLALHVQLISIQMMALIEKVSDLDDPLTREGLHSLLDQLDGLKTFSAGLTLPEGPEGDSGIDAS
jgi:predicted transcriptional regulator